MEIKKDIIVVIDSDQMGRGDDENLGQNLMKVFIHTLTELEEKPKSIILYNKGVMLADEDSENLDNLKKLETMGVTILSCTSCANFYDILDRIKVGTLTNMHTIVKMQMKADKIIKP